MEEILALLIAIWGFGGIVSAVTATDHNGQIVRPFFLSFLWYHRYHKGLIPNGEQLNGNKFKTPRGGKDGKTTSNSGNRR